MSKLMPDPRLNLEHVENPQVGDYWQEMLVPILLVLKVNKRSKTVTFTEKKIELDTNYYTWDLENPSVLKFEDFKKKLLYKHQESTWADVVPNADRHKDFIKEYNKITRKPKNK
jgi:hypothetical protein